VQTRAFTDRRGHFAVTWQRWRSHRSIRPTRKLCYT